LLASTGSSRLEERVADAGGHGQEGGVGRADLEREGRREGRRGRCEAAAVWRKVRQQLSGGKSR